MVLAEPPASKWVGFWGSFQPEKKLECHPFLNSQPLPYHHIIISHQWKPCRPYSSIFHIRFPVLLVNRGWLWQVGLPKFFPSCAPLQGITKNLEDLSDTFTVLKSNKLCPEKKNTFLRGTSSFKVLVDKASHDDSPLKQNYFSWSLQALLAAKLRKERLRTRTNTSPWYRPWLQEADSWSMSVLWVSKSFGRFRGQKIIGGKPAKYAHPVHDGKSLTNEVTTRLLPPCAKRAKASLRRSP
jgi:hypothetical protein